MQAACYLLNIDELVELHRGEVVFFEGPVAGVSVPGLTLPRSEKDN